jgi:hypothetical protein
LDRKTGVIIIAAAALALVGALAAVLALPEAGGLSGPAVLYDGPVNISAGTSVFTAAGSNVQYPVDNSSLYGVLAAVCAKEGLSCTVADRDWNPRLHSQVVEEIGGFREENGTAWNCTVNDAPVLLSSAEDGVLTSRAADGDRIIFFYGPEGCSPTGASAVIRTVLHLEEETGSAPASGSLALSGLSEYQVTPEIYREALLCHGRSYAAPDGSLWSGVPVWFFIGCVDGRESPHHPMLGSSLASAGYNVTFTGKDGAACTMNSTVLVRNNDYLIAYMKDGSPLLDGPAGPFALVGPGMGERTFEGVVSLALSDYDRPQAAPSVTITRYAADGQTVLNETTVDTAWMEANLPVLGNETVPYRIQGPTFDRDDLWNPGEEKNPAKVEDAVLGTAIRDLCDLVGGMDPGDRVVLSASDGYAAELRYENVYAPRPEQGEAILSWWSARQGYAPAYADGPRLFYLAPDNTFGNENMRTCLAEEAWVYYWTGGVQYPSAAGTSVRGVDHLSILPANAG